MPSTVEEFFSLKGLSPYPTLRVDRFWCSCPDWSKPCKHIAAVLYLLGDALVRDPLADEAASSAEMPLPLWKGSARLSDALAKIYRRTGII